MKSPVIALASVLVLAASLFAAARPAFNVQYNYDIDQGARDILAIDFNGDGIADVATANELSNTVSTFMSSPDGSLFFVVGFPVAGGPIELAGGDFDADGDNDIAALCNNGTIRILLNKGNGRFETGPLVSAGAEPNGIVAANFDGDQYCDLAVTVHTIDSVLIFHGDAGAAMAVRTPFPAGTLPTGLSSGDIDGDGDQDLYVVGSIRPTQLTLYNDGLGAFSIFDLQDWNDTLNFSALGDLTGEGHLEAVALFPRYGKEGDFYTHWCDISWNFPESPRPNSIFDFVSGWQVGICASLEMHDLDLNGASEMILSRPDSARIDVYYSDVPYPRDSSLSCMDIVDLIPYPPRRYPVNGIPGFTTAADLDGDGYPELLVLLQDRDQLVVMPNFLVGDLNGDRILNLQDITALISYIYLGGQEPVPVERANVNGSADGVINLQDVAYLIGTVYLGGPPPVD